MPNGTACTDSPFAPSLGAFEQLVSKTILIAPLDSHHDYEQIRPQAPKQAHDELNGRLFAVNSKAEEMKLS